MWHSPLSVTVGVGRRMSSAACHPLISVQFSLSCYYLIIFVPLVVSHVLFVCKPLDKSESINIPVPSGGIMEFVLYPCPQQSLCLLH